MKTINRQVFVEVFKFTDILVVSLSILITDLLLNSYSTMGTYSELIVAKITILEGLFFTSKIVVWHLILSKMTLYNNRRIISYFSELVLLIKALIICFVFDIFSKLLANQEVRFFFIAVPFISCVVILGLFRAVLHFVLELSSLQKRNRRYVVIVGTGERAQRYADLIASKPNSGYIIRGFVDTSWFGGYQKRHRDLTIVSNFDTFSSYIRENVIDEIFICLPLKTHYHNISTIVAAAEEQGILVRMSTDLFDLKSAQPQFEYFDEKPLITLVSGKMYCQSVLVKVLMDLTGAFLLLLALLPILMMIALAIKLTSKGPIFFLQPRIGMNKRVFNVIKFRTMVCNAEALINEIAFMNDRQGEPVFKIKNDPRVTFIGRILRKYSLDELPQLFNVLKGDMSLVGPRPLPIRDYKGFNQDWQRRRFSVKPGITCTWQISGRDNITFEKWMEMDMAYIDNWSVWLDCKILLKTVPACIMGVGAS